MVSSFSVTTAAALELKGASGAGATCAASRESRLGDHGDVCMVLECQEMAILPEIAYVVSS
jgi:hypothetical protein